MALAAPLARPAAPAAPKKTEARGRAREADLDELDAEVLAEAPMKFDREQRKKEAPMFRVADTTQECAENNWWHRRPEDCNADLFEPNRLWRDLAKHETGPFLSAMA